jgi:phosphate transport system permease protein
MMKERLRFRETRNMIFKFFIIVCTLISIIPLVLLIVYIFRQGISVINWHFLTSLPKPVGEAGGGILNALIGSLLIILVATMIAVPFGVSMGMYFSESSPNWVYKIAHLCVDVLQGIPSIVIGIIIYLWLVKPFGQFSAFSGSVALSFMMLPSIIKSTEETLKLVPHSLKEASLSLGVPYYKTMLRVIMPAGISGILNGIILGIARVAGETAPLLFTAFGNPFMSFNIFKPIASLPLIIFNYAISPYEDWHRLAWGASFILVSMVLILNIITKVTETRWKVQF